MIAKPKNGPSKEQTLKEIAVVIRSLITSTKPPVVLRRIVVHDYPEIEGRPIPYRELGYKSPEELLQDTGEFSFSRIGNETIIAAKFSAKSAHIASMVLEQKISKSCGRLTVGLPPPRRPRRTDRTWTSSSFSSNSYRKSATPTPNRYILSQDRGNSNSQNSTNRSAVLQQQQKREEERQKKLLVEQNDTIQKLQKELAEHKKREAELLSLQEEQKKQLQIHKEKEKELLRQQQNEKQQLLQQQQEKQLLLKQQQEKQLLAQQQKEKQLLLQQQKEKQQQLEQTQQRELEIQQQHKLRQQQLREEQEQQLRYQKEFQRREHVRLVQLQFEQEKHWKLQQHQRFLIQEKLSQHIQQHVDIHRQAQEKKAKIAQIEVIKELRPVLAAKNNLKPTKPTKMATSKITSIEKKISLQNRLALPILHQQQKLIEERREQLEIQRREQQELQARKEEELRQQQRKQLLEEQRQGIATRKQQTAHNVSLQNRLNLKKTPNIVENRVEIPKGPAQPIVNNKTDVINAETIPAAASAVGDSALLDCFSRENPTEALDEYAKLKGYQRPDYTTYQLRLSKKYYSRVKIGEFLFTTYPKEYATEYEARLGCSRGAVAQLKESVQNRGCPACTDSNEKLLDKLYNELLKHPRGFFLKNIPGLFEKTYQETLPTQWFSMVQSSKKFCIEQAVADKQFIIYAVKEDNKENISMTPNSGFNQIERKLEPLELPWEEKHWYVLITSCESTIEVWGRLWGEAYSNRYDSMLEKINNHMLTNKERPTCISVNDYYLVSVKEIWYRVQVEEIDKVKGSALIKFVDFGDLDTVLLINLYNCDGKFLDVPAQAVKFSMFGLEDCYRHPAAVKCLADILLSKSLVAEVWTKQSEYLDRNSPISVAFCDTSSEEDVHLNPLLLEKICDATPLPELSISANIQIVVVARITDEGDVYLQLQNSELKYMQNLMQQSILSKFSRDKYQITKEEMKSGVRFLVSDVTSGSQPQWYRGTLAAQQTSENSKDVYDIECIDYARTIAVHISNIFRLESLSHVLNRFPKQAVRVRLHGLPPINKDIVGRLRALLPLDGEALVKVHSMDNTPDVTIYRRLGGPEKLFTVNDVICVEYELENSAEKINANDFHNSSALPMSPDSQIKKSNSLANIPEPLGPKVLTPQRERANSLDNSKISYIEEDDFNFPRLEDYSDMPDVGNYLEVRVSMASNPSNFMFQPYTVYSTAFRIMMKELQEYCTRNQEFLSTSKLRIGESYAAKSVDGLYSRVIVVNIYSSEMIQVFFCDFGDMSVLGNNSLKVLPSQFRKLPKIAIPAKLYGIKTPDKNGEWGKNSIHRFRELTVGKHFIGIPKKIVYDEDADKKVKVYEIELLDVNQEKDGNIGMMLVEEKLAIRP